MTNWLREHWEFLALLGYTVLALVSLYYLRKVLPIPGGDLF